MKRRGIKNLIIDFGGVLIDLDRQRCLENFRKLGLPDVEVMLDLYHQQDFFQKYEKGLITSAEFREVIGNGRVCTRFATRLAVRRTFLSISISLMR